MPRQDVPYGGAICRLRERIAEIWDKLGEKLHSINGVEGDAAGDVKIVSGDAAITISEDQVNHQIEIALDSSQLPAASVSSVNGQTGAVALDAGDIPSDNGDVQTDLDALALRVTANGTAISNEVIDRQNADAALQGNINAALATIPGEVSSQIASDATIAQLVAADAQNVKLTGNQNISGVKSVPIETTGTYSQQIANSQKIKNELDSYTPMVRTTGNQTIMGIKTMQEVQARVSGFRIATFIVAANKYYKLYEYNENSNFVLRLKGNQPNNNLGWIKIYIGGTAYFTRSVLLEKVSRYSTVYVYTCTNTVTNKDEIIMYTGSNVIGTVNVELMEGFMGSTYVASFEETTDPNTDGNHTNIQRFG